MSTELPDDPSPEALARNLVDLLDVEEIDTDLYRGKRLPGGVGRVFGGQVIAQALQAAQRSTGDSKVAHSLHAYFMRPGNEDFPIIFRVVRDFEGRSFANRRVVAMQRGKPILNMAASFQTPEEGLHHQDPMPDVPPPDSLRPERELHAELADRIPPDVLAPLLRRRSIEVRPIDQRSWLEDVSKPPRLDNWFKVVGPIGDDPAIHRAALAYATDISLLGTAMLPHAVNSIAHKLQTASLDHALWMHEDFRADDWMLYSCDSPWAGHARGFTRGRIFSRDGRLIANVTQEGLIRMRE